MTLDKVRYVLKDVRWYDYMSLHDGCIVVSYG